MKKIVSAFFATLLLFSVLLSASCSVGRTSNGIHIVRDRRFSFNDSDLSKYVALSLEDITGLDVDIDVENITIDRAAVEKEFRYLRLYNANCEELRKDTYLGNPEWGDQVYLFYDLSKTEGGESVGSNLFSSESRKTVSIGFYEFSDRMMNFHPLFDNEQVSAALLNVTPAERKTSGVVIEGDSLRVSFTAKFKDGSVYKQGAYARVDTKSIFSDSYYEDLYGIDFVDALFEHNIGEKYTFDTVLDVTDDKGNVTEKEVTYEVKIDYAVKESFTTIAVDLPAGAFDETYSQELRALNGTRVYLSVTVDAFADYNVSEFDVNFITQYLGLMPKENETIDAFYERAYEAQRLALEEERKKEVSEKMLAYFAQHVFTQDRIKKIPEAPYREHINVILNTLESAYNFERETALKSGQKFSYASIEEYAREYLNYTSKDFPSLQAYAEQTALETLTDRLFIFRVIELSGDRLSTAEVNKERDDYLEVLKQQFPDYTETEILQKFEEDGGFDWYVNYTIALGYFTDYIYNNNSYH